MVVSCSMRVGEEEREMKGKIRDNKGNLEINEKKFSGVQRDGWGVCLDVLKKVLEFDCSRTISNSSPVFPSKQAQQKKESSLVHSLP